MTPRLILPSTRQTPEPKGLVARRLLSLVLIVIATIIGASGQSISYVHDRAMGVNLFNPQGGFVPISYGQVRVCTTPTTGSPCTTPTTVYDIFGNPLTVVGGNFGQLTTDVVGNFNFGCVPGTYEIQVAAASSNTPQLNYLYTCSGSSGAASINPGNGITVSGSGTITISLTTPVTVANGGSGATSLTGILKGNGGAAFSAAASADVISLFAGCSGTQYLGADGSCHTAGSGTITAVNPGVGISGGGSSGTVTVTLGTSYQLPQVCSSGVMPNWNGSTWVCSSLSDNGTTIATTETLSAAAAILSGNLFMTTFTAGQPLVILNGSSPAGQVTQIPEFHSVSFPGFTLNQMLALCPASPTPCRIVLDAGSTMTVPSTATIGSTTQQVIVDDMGQPLQITGILGQDGIDIAQWGALVCHKKGVGASSTGCFIGSSAGANVTSLVSNSAKDGINQADVVFNGFDLQPAGGAIITKATVWFVSVEGKGKIADLGIGCVAGGVGLQLEDGPATGDNGEVVIDNVQEFGGGNAGCIPLQIFSTATGTGRTGNILFNGGSSVDTKIAPINLATTAAITVTGPQTVAVTNTTNLVNGEQVQVTGSDNNTEFIKITSFVANTSVTANFTLTHVSGSTLTTGLCWTGNGCTVNIDGAAGVAGTAAFVNEIRFNNYYIEGIAGSAVTGEFLVARNCRGCAFDNMLINGGPIIASVLHWGATGGNIQAGWFSFTGNESGQRATNWIVNDITGTTIPTLGGDSFTYFNPGTATKIAGLGYNVDGAITFWNTNVSSTLKGNANGTLTGTTPTITTVSLTSHVGAVVTTTLTTSVANAALYRVSGVIQCDVAAASSATVTIGWTDTSSTAQTFTANLASCASLGASSFVPFSETINVKASTNITYAIAVAGGPTYDFRTAVEQLSGN